MRSISIILLLLSLQSCVTLKPRIPLFGIFNAIHNAQYVVDVNDCSDKAEKYMHALKAAGYSSETIVIRLKTGELHAVVFVDNIYVDPTYGSYSSLIPGKHQYSIKDDGQVIIY